MRKKAAVLALALSVALTLGLASGAMAMDELLDSVAQGCQKELTTYCAKVTPGQGRVLACLYAFSDQLSPACEYALYDASMQLERAVNMLSYLATECDDDLEKYCSKIQPGQGRVLVCLDKHKAEVAPRCQKAIKSVGLEVVK